MNAVRATRHPGKVAIVTGAARGLGLGITARLVEDGMTVILSDVASDLETVAASLGANALAHRCDVSDASQVDTLVDEAVGRQGRLDLFVANAGIGAGGPIAEMDDETYRRIVAVNLDGVFFSCRAAARVMIAQGSGCIVTVGSIFGRDTPARSGVYGATKAGVMAMTHALARELGPHGIRVNCISPGNMATEMHWAVLEQRARERGVPVEQVIDEVRATIPLGRHGTGDDVGAVVSFLASDDAAYVSGQTLNVDGGYQPR
jgi:NAD(P)-dependent dehydrogenase (short-subunit alcohol dehydrogenase family)